MLRYALILGDSNMINVNVFGLLTNMIYMIIYYHYAPNTVFLLTLKYINLQLFKTFYYIILFFLERSA